MLMFASDVGGEILRVDSVESRMPNEAAIRPDMNFVF